MTDFQNWYREVFVTLFGSLVLLLSVLNLTRGVGALVLGPILSEYDIRPGTAYLAATGLVWAGAGGALFAGMGSKRSWWPDLGLLLASAYTLYIWLDRLLLRPRGVGPDWLFTLAVNLLLLLIIVPGLLDAKNHPLARKP